MAREPKEAQGNEPVKRSVSIPGNLYNRFVRAAREEHRDVNSQLVAVMEMYLREREKQEPAPAT
jgi:hypothetical protein